MSKDPLANIEFKSLRVLSLLLKTPSITEVAEKLSIQPSSVTYHLNKLRQTLNDPLLVQVGKRMEPTARALSLIPKLATLLINVEDILQTTVFDPKTVSQEFRVAIQDIGAEVLLPILLDRLSHEAPNVSVKVIDWHKNTEQKMHEGKVDLALNSIVHMSTQLHGYQIGSTPLSLVTAKEHPLATTDYCVADIFDYPHVRAFPAAIGEGLIDKLAEKYDKKRTVAASASSFSVLAAIVKTSNKVGVFPAGVAQHLGTEHFYTKQIQEIDPIPVHCFWHQRCHNDPIHQFMRSVIIDISAALMEQRGLKPT
ncbi:LysR substrate-binding domain-containing protein [Vibrio breoganii]